MLKQHGKKSCCHASTEQKTSVTEQRNALLLKQPKIFIRFSSRNAFRMAVPGLWMTITTLRKSVTTRKNILLRKHHIISARWNSFPYVSFASAPRWITAASSLCSVLPVKNETKSRLLLEFIKSGAGAPPSIAILTMADETRANMSALERPES